MIHSKRYVWSIVLFSSLAMNCWGGSYTITTTADDGSPGSLRGIIQQINASTDTSNTINNNIGNGPISLGSPMTPLAPLNATGQTTVFNGGGLILIGSNAFQAVSVYVGNLQLNDVDILTSSAIGGTGGSGAGAGGGGAGLGGGLFVRAGSQVTIGSVVFENNSAVGGAGGVTNGATAGGGGGGLFGNGGSTGDIGLGGGGGGFIGAGGNGDQGGGGGGGLSPSPGGSSTGGVTGGGGGGGAGTLAGGASSSVIDGGAGGASNGGGGGGCGEQSGLGTGGAGNGSGATGGNGTIVEGGAGGAAGPFGGGGGGGFGGTTASLGISDGGNGGTGIGDALDNGGGGGGGGGQFRLMGTNTANLGNGGLGGFGSGGGGSGSGLSTARGYGGGDGGFGGGGGGKGPNSTGTGVTGGAGGFGGGGGGTTAGSPGTGGTYGGAGGATGEGGGGAGLGGAIFLEKGTSTAATLTILDGCAFSGNSVTAGTGANPGQAFGADIFMMNGTTLNVDINGNLTIPNAIEANTGGSGGGLNKSGTGTLIMAGTRLTPGYTGPTTITGGTLQTNATNIMPDIGLVTVTSPGIFNLNGFSQTVVNVSGTGTIQLNGGATLTTGNANPATFSGPITGTGILNYAGTNTFTLDGVNTYSGGTEISTSGGIIAIGSTGKLPVGGAVTMAAGTTLDISAATVTQTIGNLTATTTSTLALGNNQLTYAPTSSPPNFVAEVTGSTSSVFAYNAPFTLDLDSVLASQGTFQIVQGTVQPMIMNALINGDLVIVNAGAIFNLGGTSQTIGNLSGNGSVHLGGAGATLTTGGANAAATFGGSITGGSGNLDKTGTGNFTLTGINGYNGTTSITAGTLSLSGTGTLPTNSLIDISPGATLDISGATVPVVLDTISDTGTLQLGSSTLNYTPSSSATASFALLGTSGSTFNNTQNNTTFGVESGMDGTIEISGGSIIADAMNIFPNIALLNVGTAGTFSLVTFNQTINNITGSGIISLGTATLTTGSASSTTFSGDITGTGGLTKEGSGDLTLTGMNGYSGTTSITAGTLSLSGTGTLATNSLISISPGATLDISGATVPVVLDTISGTGTVQLGSSTLNYTPSSSAIASFVLLGASGSTFNNTQNNTTFGVESGMDGTIEISGGTITADAMNIFPNITLLNVGVAGTFSLVTFNQTISNITGSGMINLGTATLTTGSASSTTFSGDIAGMGDVTKVGAGTLTLSGTSTYSGPTSVNAGTLFISGTGTINSPPTVGSGALMVVNGTVNGATIVNAGGTLKGTGTISNTLDVFGTLQPGNSIGTITVAGNVTFHPGSTYAVEVSPTAADLLNVTAGGSVSILSGSTLALTFDPGTYTPGTVYTIIDAATGSVTGTFSTVRVTHPVLLTPTVIYLPMSVELAFEIGAKGTFFGATGNAGAVAKCLNAFKAMPGTDIGTIFMALMTAPNAKSLQHALNQMQPSQFNALQLSQENTGVRVLSTISSRTKMIRQNCWSSNSSTGVWIDGFGDAMNQRRQDGQYSFHAETGGLVAGIDQQVPSYRDLYFGAGGSYTWTHVHWNGHHGQGNINSGYGFVYAALNKPYFFMNGTFFGASNHYQAKRHIGFLGINRNAHNHHKGYSIGGELDISFPIPVSCFEIAPLLSVNYDYLHQTSYKEHGAKSLDLKVRQKNSDLLRAKAGIGFSKPCKPWRCNSQPSVCSATQWAPYGELSVIREYRFHGRHAKASLRDIDCTFTVKGLNPDRTLIAPTLGVNIFFNNPKIDLNLDYSGEFDVSGKFWDQKGNVQLGYAF